MGDGRALAAFANSTLAFVELAAGLALLQYNPVLAFLLLAACADNLLDVYAATTRWSPPSWYPYVNAPLEFVSLLAAMAGVAYTIAFTTYFSLPLMLALLFVFTLDAFVTGSEMAPQSAARAESEWVE